MPRGTQHNFANQGVGAKLNMDIKGYEICEPPPERQGGCGGLVNLGECRATMPANEVFSAAELEDRIANYAARAAAKLPLFDADARAELQPDRTRDIVCWACCAVAPRSGNQCQKDTSRATSTVARWVSRMHYGNLTEIYCPECFEVWGWPDEYAAEVERYNRMSDECARAEELARSGDAAGVQRAGPDAGRVRRECVEVVSVQPNCVTNCT